MSRFVGESITPVMHGAAGAPVVPGEPIIPSGFTWRGREYRVESVLERWKESGPCRHGSPERYVRKHWYRIRMTDGTQMEIYFERQARSSRERKRRWWLFAVSDEKRG
jgi:hypothetical protein